MKVVTTKEMLGAGGPRCKRRITLSFTTQCKYQIQKNPPPFHPKLSFHVCSSSTINLDLLRTLSPHKVLAVLFVSGLLVSVLLSLRDAEVFLQGWIGTGLVWGWESKEAAFGALNASRLTLSSGALRILVTLSYQ